MRLRPIRVRTLMIAVALIALGLAGYFEVRRLIKQSEEYERIAKDCGLSLGRYKALLPFYRVGIDSCNREVERLKKEGNTSNTGEIAQWEASAEISRKKERSILSSMDYTALVKAKYERAARYPWLPTPADPPVPPDYLDPP